MNTIPIGLKINNQLYLTEKNEKSWRENNFVYLLFFGSIILMYYFIFVGYVNSFSVDIDAIIGFGNYYFNFCIALLIFSLVIYLLYSLLFKFLTVLMVGLSFYVLFDKIRIKKYFFFWYTVRNILIFAIYFISLYFPILINFTFFIKMVLTFITLFLLFLDLVNYVFGEIIGTFVFSRISKFVVAYYSISTIVNYWSLYV